MKKKLLLLFMIFSLTSCSFNSGKIEKKSSNEENELKGEYRASYIFVQSKEAADNIIDMINKDVNSGEKIQNVFCEYVTKYSQGNNGSACGDTDFFNKGDMVEEFEKTVEKLKVNEYTKKAVYIPEYEGYYIILRTE